MLEVFVIGATAGARGVGVFGPPGGVGGQVALVGVYLVKASCDKLVQAHKRVGVEATGVDIVIRGGMEGVPLV